MKLTKEQLADIKNQQSQQNSTKRVTVPELENILYEAIPSAIAKNKKAKSSGSLTGVLNLITDNAPTKPSDNANDDLTIKITKNVILLKSGIIAEI